MSGKALKKAAAPTRSPRPGGAGGQAFAPEPLRGLIARLEAHQEAERHRVSREMHDRIGEVVTGMDLALGWMHLACTENNTVTSAPLLERLATLRSLTSDLAQQVRRLCTELRPAVLDDFGLAATLTWLATDFHKRTGIRCAAAVAEQEIPLSPDQATALFRILEEALNNVVRHSKASKVALKLTATRKQVTLEVKDNGCGLRPEHVSSGKSGGLLAMQERAHRHGGQVTLVGRPGKGTCVRVQFPLARAASRNASAKLHE